MLYVVQSSILRLSILLSYHYRCNVVFTNYRFPVSFLLYIATQKNLTKSLPRTVLRILLSPKKSLLHALRAYVMLKHASSFYLYTFLALEIQFENVTCINDQSKLTLQLPRKTITFTFKSGMIMSCSLKLLHICMPAGCKQTISLHFFRY